MLKAKDRNRMPGYEVEQCDETIRKLISDIHSVTLKITHGTSIIEINDDPDKDSWDWGTAGMLSAALCSLKDVCRLLKIDN